ncbi:MAG: phosphotransferase, partial [Muribaculaceae bacterium]|nr:phosphotransferase [Muribaculaceae bacterium]
MKRKDIKEETERDSLLHLYRMTSGEPGSIEALPSAGSDRRYFRITDAEGRSVVGCYGSDMTEDRCFVDLSRIFRNEGINVPEIYAADIEKGIYLQEDLGGTDLLSCLSGPDRMLLAEKSIRNLVGMQNVGEAKWAGAVFNHPFSERMVMWDLNYFKYDFLRPAGIPFDEGRLEDDFERLAEELTGYHASLSGFMYRDFQSRNIMIKDGEPYFIDYQGGRTGPMTYDVVSFLWQAKASFTKREREYLLDVYFAEMEKKRPDAIGLRESVGGMVLLRTLQVLGAYGFRGLIEKKAHFIESIPGALLNLKELIAAGALRRYPELEKVANLCVESRFARKYESVGLTVKVFSFSYKKGYPEDLSGNGGGFMFDCRGMHNPGRYAEYRSLTGRDPEVIEFLESKGEVG